MRATYLHAPPRDGLPNQIIHPGEAVSQPHTLHGIEIRLDLANDGEHVRNLADDWSKGEGIGTLPTGMQNGALAGWIVYKFDVTKLGQPVPITISFETQDGLKLHQVYETRHGYCELRRVDPA